MSPRSWHCSMRNWGEKPGWTCICQSAWPGQRFCECIRGAEHWEAGSGPSWRAWRSRVGGSDLVVWSAGSPWLSVSGLVTGSEPSLGDAISVASAGFSVLSWSWALVSFHFPSPRGLRTSNLLFFILSWWSHACLTEIIFQAHRPTQPRSWHLAVPVSVHTCSCLSLVPPPAFYLCLLLCPGSTCHQRHLASSGQPLTLVKLLFLPPW